MGVDIKKNNKKCDTDIGVETKCAQWGGKHGFGTQKKRLGGDKSLE
jgi:hypothetical protein